MRPLGFFFVVVACLGGVGCASNALVARPAAFPGAMDSAALAGGITPEAGQAILRSALALRGTPYRLGGADPVTGFDCSGLVRYVFSENGVVVPRTASEQYAAGLVVDERNMMTGDLVFFSTIAPGASHVGILIDGRSFLHAPGTGRVVRVDTLDTPYWRERLLGVRRVAATP